MTHENNSPIDYFLSLDEKPVAISSFVDSDVKLHFSGTITCVECGRKIKKTYDSGYCFPCARDLPENAMCSVRPETCEHESGNERDRAFFQEYCNVSHFVYLSLTSSVKVGVTRSWNIPSRWIDQGAVSGLIVAKTPDRKTAGEIEISLAKHMSDKTNWRKMLKGDIDEVSLVEWRDKARLWLPADFSSYWLDEEETQGLVYPVKEYPEKVVSHNLDKEPVLEGRLMGIKGQYLIFESKVINLRKYAGYHIGFEMG